MTAVQIGRRRGGAVATVSTDTIWTVETIPIAGLALRLGRAGAGPPALVLPVSLAFLEPARPAGGPAQWRARRR